MQITNIALTKLDSKIDEFCLLEIQIFSFPQYKVFLLR